MRFWQSCGLPFAVFFNVGSFWCMFFGDIWVRGGCLGYSWLSLGVLGGLGASQGYLLLGLG